MRALEQPPGQNQYHCRIGVLFKTCGIRICCIRCTSLLLGYILEITEYRTYVRIRYDEKGLQVYTVFLNAGHQT
jgi:hypothetical protein